MVFEPKTYFIYKAALCGLIYLCAPGMARSALTGALPVQVVLDCGDNGNEAEAARGC